MLFLRKRKHLRIASDKLEIPSGKKEVFDREPKDTMIREAREELLINVSKTKLGNARIDIPQELYAFWDTILQKENIVDTVVFTKKETRASDITIGILIVDLETPCAKLQCFHQELFLRISKVFFGGDKIETQYIPSQDWCPSISKDPHRETLWKYLEAFGVEYVNIDIIPTHPNMNFRRFWEKMISTLHY
tara:strand:- start:584 stop:1156 length:573 start_codon:yes stop_codon:yes gene_type:complete